jgi:hypothetical protein
MRRFSVKPALIESRSRRSGTVPEAVPYRGLVGTESADATGHGVRTIRPSWRFYSVFAAEASLILVAAVWLWGRGSASYVLAAVLGSALVVRRTWTLVDSRGISTVAGVRGGGRVDWSEVTGLSVRRSGVYRWVGVRTSSRQARRQLVGWRRNRLGAPVTLRWGTDRGFDQAVSDLQSTWDAARQPPGSRAS